MCARNGMWRATLLLIVLLLFCGLGNQAAASSILMNGDFELGTASWSTDYIEASDLFPSGGLFAVTTNPALVHSGAASYPDHTPSGTLMMVVNGATTADTVVWEQTVTGVNTSIDYIFSGFVSSWFGLSPANLEVMINGTSIGMFMAPSSVGMWELFEGVWTPDSSTAMIQIIDRNLAHAGNDFALDDLSFAEVPEPSTALFLGFGLLGLGVYAWGRKKRA